MLLRDAFTALLIIIICSVSSDTGVPPPSNVLVRCQNLQTIVSWDYSQLQPHTIFRVNITGSMPLRHEVNTTDHHYNLSQFIWDSQDNYLAFLSVSVTAVQGGKRSEPEKSKSFSFNPLKSVDTRCVLQFPPVDVREIETGVSVSFDNPLHFYKELKRTVKTENRSHNTYLSYKVTSTTNSAEFKEKCHRRDVKCKRDVTLDGEKCVTLEGELIFDKSLTQQVKFEKTAPICSKKHGEVNDELVLLVILGSVFTIVVVASVAIICKLKAWTMKTPIPQIRVDSSGKGAKQSFFVPSVTHLENAQVLIFPLYEKAFRDSEEENCSEPPQASKEFRDLGAAEGCEGRECLKSGNLNLEEEGLMCGAKQTDEDSADESLNTECVSISSSEEERSPYDSPHIVLKDMGNGDTVTGYTGN